MTPRSGSRVPFLVVFVLPAALLALLAGIIGALSLRNITESYRVTADLQARNLSRVAAATHFNQKLALVQRLVAATLEQAARRPRDEHELARLRSDVLGQLAALKGELKQLAAGAPAGAGHNAAFALANQDFDLYRNGITLAMVLSASDPQAAIGKAYLAAQAQLALSEHSHAIVSASAADAVRLAEQQRDTFEQQARRIVLTGGALLAVLIGLWLLLIRRMVRRAADLSDALDGLASGQLSPARLSQVEAMAQEPASLLRNMALAVLAFREAVQARQKARDDLAGRMREMACLHDVSRLGADETLDAPALLAAVAERLRSALRHPETAAVCIDFGDIRVGETRIDGQHDTMVAQTLAADGVSACRLTVSCRVGLPAQADEHFLPDERGLLEAVSLRLSGDLARRHAQGVERETQALLSAIVEQAAYAINLVDAESRRFIMVNAACCQLLGYSRSELLEMTIDDIQAEPDPVQLRERIARILGSGSASFENRFCRKDGRRIDAHIDARACHQRGRQYMVVLWTDITAQKQAQASLRMLSAAVAQSPNAVVITDLQADIVYVNDAFVRSTGYSRDEALGRNPRLLQSGRTPRATYESLWRALSAGQPWSGEFINRTKDGAERTESAIITPLRGDDGQVNLYVAIKEDITERRRVEQTLRELYLAVEQSPESIVITNLEARIEYVNQAFVRNTGYSRDEARGLNPRILKSGKTPPETYRAMWAALTRGEPWRGELFNRRKDGSEYCELASITPVHQPDGSVTHYLAIKEDITERRRMAEELDAYREHLEKLVASRTTELERTAQALRLASEEQQALFDSASVGMVLRQGPMILRCNRRAEEMFGYAPGSLVGQSTGLWYADAAANSAGGPEVDERIWRGETHLREQQVVRKDGSRFWVRMSGRAIDAAQPDKGVVCIIEDISAERAAAHAVRLANEEQQAIFDTASSGMALIKDGLFVRCNRRLQEILRCPADSLAGQSPAEFFSDQGERSNFLTEAYRQIWSGQSYSGEMAMRRSDGEPFWARLTGKAVDTGDRAKGTVWVIDDISVEHAAATATLQAKALAEAAARAKSDFLANMSHEIRTPMNAIIGMTHLALKTPLTPRQRDYLHKIQGSSQHLLGIINDILDVSKIEAGKLALEHTGFELAAVLDNVRDLIGEKAAAKGLELVFDVAPDVPEHLVGDPLRLGQVLINYANNAVKFTERGEIGIQVRQLQDSGSEVLLQFAVRDTGIGLTTAQRRLLFQSFQQADSSTTRKHGGTGLGLVISRQLAGLMHGEVGVDSTPGQGSTFWFTARLGKATAGRRPRLLSGDLHGQPALVVDDNATARRITAQLLRTLGLAADEAASGPAALAAITQAEAQGRPYRIAFIDWQMQPMDGVATAQGLRALALQRPPHRVLMTAHCDEELLAASEAAGLDDVLLKPLNASLLFDCVASVLGCERSARPADAPAPVLPAPALQAIAGARVLLVEDNELNQEVADELLREAGLVVDIADNGLVALDKLAQSSYDIVLMDMQMPVMDGLAATREIRRRPAWADLPVIAMTANVMADDRQRCLDAGMNEHLAKPIEPDELWRVLLSWVKPHHAPAGAAAAPAPAADDGGLPAHIPGIDLQDGLRRVLGRKPLYLSMLRRFASGQKSLVAELQAAVGAGDLASAQRLAHTAKGNAGSIGAASVQALAAEVERRAAQHQSPEAVRAAVAALAPALASLIDTLAQQLPPEAPLPSVAVDPAALRAVCSRLEALLAYDDAAAMDLVDENAELLASGLPDHHRRIHDAIRQFDFEAALAALREATAAP